MSRKTVRIRSGPLVTEAAVQEEEGGLREEYEDVTAGEMVGQTIVGFALGEADGNWGKEKVWYTLTAGGLCHGVALPDDDT